MTLPHEPPRVAVISGTLMPGDRHAETALQLQALGIPGYAAELIDAGAAGDALIPGRHALLHLLAPGPNAGAIATHARSLGMPVIATHHAGRSTGAAALEVLYAGCDYVTSPTRATDARLAVLGVPAGRMLRWRPGVDGECFGPARYGRDVLPPHPDGIPDPLTLLACGPLEGSAERLLAGALARCRVSEPRLHLVVIGATQLCGPAITPLGAFDRDALARVYASADMLVSPALDGRFGHAVLEAQASGLPVLALADSGAAELIEPGRSGCLVAPTASALAEAICGLARRAALRERLSTGGLATARAHTWPRALAALGACWDRVPLAAAVPYELESVRAA